MANTLQSRASEHSFVIGPFGLVGGGPGLGPNKLSRAVHTGMARFYVPPHPGSDGITVKRVTLVSTKFSGAADMTINVMNELTTMLSAAVGFKTAQSNKNCPLANNGWEVVKAGRYIRIDGSETSAGKWDSSVQGDVSIQIDYSRNGR